MSAPLCLITSCGESALPVDFDILSPDFVEDEAAGDDLAERRAAFDGRADEQRRVEPAAMLVVAFEVDVGRPRRAPARGFSTAMCEQPESNQTSRMSVSLRNDVLPHWHGWS